MDNTARIEALQAVIPQLEAKDRGFATSLCDNFHRYNRLSEKQWYWVDKLTQGAGGTPNAQREEVAEQIFDGKAIVELTRKASASLKNPKLRYHTDRWGKIVFSYVADTSSKWFGCCFIHNGRKRYGFIGNTGAGRINRESPPEIKKLILEVAKNPTEAAKLSGQAYKYCCYCGLELTNKSSVYHGYGPICADNWGLPWGDTGDAKDEEDAARKELENVQLHDLE